MLTAENGTLSISVCCAHSSGPTARIVKYIANSAAKNISSLESHTIVPTLTMLGRSWCPGAGMPGCRCCRHAVIIAPTTHGTPPRPPVFRRDRPRSSL